MELAEDRPRARAPDRDLVQAQPVERERAAGADHLVGADAGQAHADVLLPLGVRDDVGAAIGDEALVGAQPGAHPARAVEPVQVGGLPVRALLGLDPQHHAAIAGPVHRPVRVVPGELLGVGAREIVDELVPVDPGPAHVQAGAEREPGHRAQAEQRGCDGGLRGRAGAGQALGPQHRADEHREHGAAQVGRGRADLGGGDGIDDGQRDHGDRSPAPRQCRGGEEGQRDQRRAAGHGDHHDEVVGAGVGHAQLRQRAQRVADAGQQRAPAPGQELAHAGAAHEQEERDEGDGHERRPRGGAGGGPARRWRRRRRPPRRRAPCAREPTGTAASPTAARRTAPAPRRRTAAPSSTWA